LDVVIHLLGVGNNVFLVYKERIIFALSQVALADGQKEVFLALEIQVQRPLLRPSLLAMSSILVLSKPVWPKLSIAAWSILFRTSFLCMLVTFGKGSSPYAVAYVANKYN
jgi:hypothetical protein